MCFAATWRDRELAHNLIIKSEHKPDKTHTASERDGVVYSGQIRDDESDLLSIFRKQEHLGTIHSPHAPMREKHWNMPLM